MGAGVSVFRTWSFFAATVQIQYHCLPCLIELMGLFLRGEDYYRRQFGCYTLAVLSYLQLVRIAKVINRSISEVQTPKGEIKPKHRESSHC